MSLSLDQGTKPEGLEVKTWGVVGLKSVVHLGDYEISMADFLSVAQYVLTNTNLDPNDPRLEFVKWVKSLEQVKGYPSIPANKQKRLQSKSQRRAKEVKTVTNDDSEY